MIERTAIKRLKKLASTFRSVAVIGPRQSGKTTLCKTVFPNKPYISLENPDILESIKIDPRAFLLQYKNGAIIDEIQKAPFLFSYLQQVLDETNKRGLYILTGSNNFLLQENITQSLAGRIAYLQLLPFSMEELKSTKYYKATYTSIMFRGFYPELLTKKIKPIDWYTNYIQTYVERDVRQLKNINNYNLFYKFLRLCAGRVGSVLNLSSIANDCGIDSKTANSWIAILQSSFIIYLLKPYYNNYNKRLIKSHKLYFYDTGLACSLLGLEKDKQLDNFIYRGQLFENLVIMEYLKNRLNNGLQDNLYFWQDKTGNEVDLLLDGANEITAFEIKSSTTINNDFFKGLTYYANIEQKKTNLNLIYGGLQIFPKRNNISIASWTNLKL
jgi:predicted AAA+ superfamily ATPase